MKKNTWTVNSDGQSVLNATSPLIPLIALTILALAFSAGSVIMVWMIFNFETGSGSMNILTFILFFGIPFPIAALVAFIFAFRNMLHYLRYGNAVLVADKFPIARGTHFKAVVRFKKYIGRIDKLICRLNCLKTVTYRRTSETQAVWHAQRDISISEIRTIGNQTEVPIDFHIPYNCPSSHPPGLIGIWHLCIGNLSFNLPVAKTQDSDPSLTQEAISAIRFKELSDDRTRDLFKAKGITVHYKAASMLDITIAPVVNRKPAVVGLIAFFTYFIGVFPVTLYLDGRFLTAILPSVPFAAFVHLMMKMLFRKTVLQLSPAGLNIVHAWIFRKSRIVPLGDIVDFKMDDQFHEHNLGTIYKISVRYPGQSPIERIGEKGIRRIKLVGSIDGSEQASWIKGVLDRHLALLRSE